MVAGNLDAARQNFQVNARKPHRFPKLPSAVSSQRRSIEPPSITRRRYASVSLETTIEDEVSMNKLLILQLYSTLLTICWYFT